MNTTKIPNIETATIIDVREPYEFHMDRLEGALNIPLGQILNRSREIDQMSKPIVVYCRSGSRSQQALLLLKARGVTAVYNAGGLKEIKNLFAQTA